MDRCSFLGVCNCSGILDSCERIRCASRVMTACSGAVTASGDGDVMGTVQNSVLDDVIGNRDDIL